MGNRIDSIFDYERDKRKLHKKVNVAVLEVSVTNLWPKLIRKF